MRTVPVILFRKSDIESIRELEIASSYFPVFCHRTAIPSNSLVISRYSCLPYFKELETDLIYGKSKLINDYQQFQYIANFDYYEDVKGYTFKTWFDWQSVPKEEDGPFVLKGRTNSRKRDWATMMYAKDRARGIKIYCDLMKDDMLSQQGIIIRKYEELEELGRSDITKQIYANEWRFFFYKGKILCYDYYWSIADQDSINKAKIDETGLAFAQKCGKIIGEKTNFYVLDIARRADGVWRLVECNDGGCSGINLEVCELMYKNLKSVLGE